MDERYSVWTKTGDPEWMERNRCSDVMLVFGQGEQEAWFIAGRLKMMYGDENLEVHPISKSPAPNTVGTNREARVV